MNHVDSDLMTSIKHAFYKARLKAPVGVWLDDEMVNAVLSAYFEGHGQIFWRGLPGQVCFSTRFGSLYCEIEQKLSGWTAYAIKEDDPESEWVAVPGTPFPTKKEAAAAAEGFLYERFYSVPDMAGGDGDRQSPGEPVTVPRETEPGLNESYGGTRDYLTRDD